MRFQFDLFTAGKNDLGGTLGSLASSGDMLGRLNAWSSRRDRGRLFVMKFHRDWRHIDCPVMGWYQQQSVSSTQFQFIEHRRSVEGPFYHELLLLRLTDGAICRVERVGEGSQSDAIRSIGCAANDLIQWFSEDEYNEFSASTPSVLISEVDFGRTFDILDVLAICYSIQTTQACRVYTLQRYNCYFLCLTVLTVLTRRMTCWEAAVPQDAWNTVVTDALARLANTRDAEPAKHLILRICKILDPKNPHPEEAVLNAIRTTLDSETGAAHAHVSEVLGQMLWWADYKSTLQIGLSEEAALSTKNLLRSHGTCAANFRHAVYNGHQDAEASIEADPALSRVYYKQLFDQVSQYCDQYRTAHESIYRTLKMEHSVSRSRMLLLKAYAPIAVFTAGIRPDWALAQLAQRAEANLFWHGVAPRHWNVVARTSAAKMMASSDRITAVQELGDYLANARLRDEGFHSDRKRAFVDFMMRMLDTLEKEGMIDRPEVWHIIGSQLSYQGLTDTLDIFMASILDPVVHDMIESKQPRFYVKSGFHGGPKKLYSPIEFQQQYVQARIQSHADRVHAHQIAAGPLVFRDIQKTMARVWRSMPSGFGDTVEVKGPGVRASFLYEHLII